MAKPTTELGLRRQVVASMKSLDVYKSEYDSLINIYAGMLYQYQLFEEQLKEANYDIIEVNVNSKGVQSEKKSPLMQTIESLRKDILAYSDKLCLNPKTLNEEKYRQEKSKPKGLSSVMLEALGGEMDV